MKHEIPPVMTFSQCQDILHVGKNTLLDLLHDGKLDGFKIGSRWRITREDLEEFMEHARWDD
ncbi:MAG: helix-turn-helix domain-containing protein [Roseburia sp.]|nr:helix-turn-helix domain-containing protein [Roseburia sp.]